MCFRDCIYPINYGCSVFVLILNIVLPGFGTMLQSFLGKKCSPCTFFVGLLQLLTVPLLLFGWVWAIWHGEMVRCVSSPEHAGKPAPETEFENHGVKQVADEEVADANEIA